ncbi:hypothetical protein LQ954_05140 [Sphingomonas sp. IC-11]|uniref:hypothetical protein n=1 Tax=Sphingomonas sp. IC-11 TaxID=2898528 RepID=UPI001E41EA93|nr:hypothetical protein [Sphingomonas sp. IC-11]MCD2315530.1 hypothetical protein [Sphingomonas sp. IC-11]
MRSVSYLPLCCGLAALAGCGEPTAPPANAIATPGNEQAAAVIPPPASGAASIVTDGRLPAAFVGRWGLVPADCTSTAGDAKGLMTVMPDRLSFYESRATIQKLEAVSPTQLRATLAFTGEGQEWTQQTPLVLEEDGAMLTREADGQTLRYTRCPA